MKKKLLIGLLVIAVIMGSVFADTLIHKLSDLLSMATEASTQAEIDDLNVSILKIRQDEAKDEAKENDFVGGNRVDALKRKIIVNVDTFNADQAVKYEVMSKAINQEQLKLDVNTATSNLILAKEQLAHEVLSLDFYKKDAAAAATKYKLGLITQLELTEKENALVDQELTIETQKSSVFEKELELKRLTGMAINGDDAMQVDYEIIASEKYTLDIESKLATYIDTSLAVIKAKDAQTAKQMIFDYTAEYYKDYDKEYKEALYNLEIAKLDYNDVHKSTEIALRNNYNKLQTLYESYDIASAYVDLYKTKLSETEAKFKLGLVSELDVDYAKLSLRQKELDVLKAAADYNKALADFELSITDFTKIED